MIHDITQTYMVFMSNRMQIFVFCLNILKNKNFQKFLGYSKQENQMDTLKSNVELILK